MGDYVSGAQEEQRRMSGGGVTEGGGGGVEMDVGRGDELALGVAVENGVHSVEELCGVGCVGTLRGGGEFDHGGDECGGDSVTGYIGDEQAGLLRSGDEEVVEVSGDGGHGNVAGGDLEVGGVGIGGGKDVGLDAAGDLQFFLDFAEFLVAVQGASRGYEAEDTEEEGEADWLDEVTDSEGCRDVAVESKEDEDGDAPTNDGEVFIDGLFGGRIRLTGQ